MYCPSCGNNVSADAIYCGICGYSVARKSAPVRYAPFLSRVGALMVDLLLMAPVILVLNVIFGHPPTPLEMQLAQSAVHGTILTPEEMMWLQTQNMMHFGTFLLITFAVGWPYYTVMETLPTQGTVGKLALRLKVTDMDGRRIGWGRANARYFGRILSNLPSCLGYLLPLFTEKKQALHDLIARCVVLRK